MSRARVIYTNEHPYHVVARVINRERFNVPLSYVFAVYVNVLEDCITRYGIKLHGFVLMNNHFHMILSTPKGNISCFLKFFMTQTSKAISRKCNRINQTYGSRNHKCVIMTSAYYAHCLKYIYRNPVKAKICERVEDYKWSTMYKGFNKMKSLVVPIETGHDEYLPSNTDELISWYNEELPEDLEAALSKAMHRTVFEVKTTHKTKKKVDPSQWLYDQSQYQKVTVT